MKQITEFRPSLWCTSELPFTSDMAAGLYKPQNKNIQHTRFTTMPHSLFHNNAFKVIQNKLCRVQNSFL